jgi:hypothetical protein
MASPRRATSAGHFSEMELLLVIGELGDARAANAPAPHPFGRRRPTPRGRLERGHLELGELRAFREGCASELAALRAFREGCDDYLRKPVSSPLLLARLRTLVRRSRGCSIPRRRIGALEIHRLQAKVTVAERPVQVSRMEFELLSHLAAGRPGSTRSRNCCWRSGAIRRSAGTLATADAARRSAVRLRRALSTAYPRRKQYTPLRMLVRLRVLSWPRHRWRGPS